MYMHMYRRFCNNVGVKSRLVAPFSRRQRPLNPLHSAGEPVSTRHQSLFTSQQNSLLHLQWLYSRGGGGLPPLASEHHHHHCPCTGLLKSLMSFPCVSKADWLIKSGRGRHLHWVRHTSLARLPSITPLVLDILTLFSLILRNRKKQKKESRLFFH